MESADFGAPIKKEPPEFTFGQIPDWIVKNGLLIHMTGNDVKLLLYLCCARYRVTGNSSRSRKTISKFTGIPTRQVSVNSEKLKTMNVIKKWRNGNRTYYHVNLKAPENYDGSKTAESICSPKTRTHISRDEEGMFTGSKNSDTAVTEKTGLRYKHLASKHLESENVLL